MKPCNMHDKRAALMATVNWFTQNFFLDEVQSFNGGEGIVNKCAQDPMLVKGTEV